MVSEATNHKCKRMPWLFTKQAPDVRAGSLTNLVLTENAKKTFNHLGHFRDVLPSQSLGIVLKKLNLTQQNHTYRNKLQHKIIPTRMWANAQPDGRPAEHRWRPLFNAAKFG